MKKLVLLLTVILVVNIFPQVNTNSAYLKNPELAIGYVDSCASFWFNAWDNSRGGFYTNVSKTGSPITSWGTQKDMITQSRNAYGLARAYMLTGKSEYLDKSAKALSFMYNTAWDTVNGGWLNSINKYGIASNTTENKTAFLQHYALVGPAAYYEATQDEYHFNWLMDGYTSNEVMLWDDDENNFGYYDYANFNWSSKNGKSFNATVDALTTHLFSLYLNREEFHIDKLKQIAANILDKIYPTMSSQAIGFAEKYNSNWEIDQSETMTITGHVLKTAWCLARLYQLEKNQDYVDAAEVMVNDILSKGYDTKNGGPYKDYNRITGEMLMWGNPDTAKAWWQMEQAVVAGLQMYNITGKEKYLQMADETTNFFMTHFVDHVYGEVYENRTKEGDETWGEHKGNGFKAGYHSIELGYYLYLYGQLLIHKQPATLYYNIVADSTETRTIRFNPLAMNLDNLKIKSIILNGGDYSDYTAETRQVNIPQNVGGEFVITYEVDETLSVDKNVNKLDDFVLEQNYPNPFNPSTLIRYQIPKISNQTNNVKLSIYDLLGQEVAVLIDKVQKAGSYEVEFDASKISSGIYFYTLKAGQFSQTKKMILLR